jgi:hypothetical protein
LVWYFALSVFNRYRIGRKPYTLMWGIGLTLYGIGTLAEAYLAIGWSSLLLRLWYLSGAMLTAAWSAWLFARKRVLPNRMMGSILIAVGGLFPASAGTFISLGWGDWLYLSELFGAALMFLGFWLATQPQTAERPAREAVRA